MISHITGAQLSEGTEYRSLFLLPRIRARHTLGVDIVAQLLSTMVYPRPDVDLEQPS